MSKELLTNLKIQVHILEQVNERQFKKELLRKKYSQVAVDDIYKEYSFSLNFLKYLSKQSHASEVELEASLRYFFKIRWAVIKKSPTAYIECPSNLMNIACEQLAIAVADEDESIAEILMQTLVVKYYQTLDEDLSTLTEERRPRKLAYHKFILSHDEKSIIPIQGWVGLQNQKENAPYLFKPYLTGANGSHQLREPNLDEEYGEINYTAYANYFNTFAPTPLDPQDLINLKSHSPQMKAYIEGIEKWQKKSMGTIAFRKSIEKLCQDCLDNGVSKHKKNERGEATDGMPHPDVYPLICDFLEKWFALSVEERERIGALTAPDTLGTFNDYISVLRSTAAAEINMNPSTKIPYMTEDEDTRRRQLNLHTCVEVNAHAITRIVNANRHDLAPLIAAIKNSPAQSDDHSANPLRYPDIEGKFHGNLSEFSACLHKQKINNNKNRFKLYHAAGLISVQNSEFVDDKNFALLCAVEVQDAPLALKYIELAADLTYADDQKRTALHYTALCNQAESCAAIIKTGKADINASDENGNTALQLALSQKNMEVANYLFMSGAQWTDAQINVLIKKARISRNYALIMDILNKVEPTRAKDLIHEHVLLQIACEQNWETLVDYCLAVPGVELDNIYAGGNTALTYAVVAKNLNIVNKLLDKGVNPNTLNRKIENSSFWSSFHHATRWSNQKIIQRLIDAGADFEMKDSEGRTPLHWAGYHNSCVANAQILINMPQIDINITDNDNKSPLEIAFEYKSIKIMILLIRANAKFSYTLAIKILTLARLHRYDQLAQAVIHKMSNEDVINSVEHDNLLHVLCYAKMTRSVNECLLRENINVNKYNLLIKSALHCAVESQSLSVVQALLDDPRVDLNGSAKFPNTPFYLAYNLTQYPTGNVNMPEIISKFIIAGIDYKSYDVNPMYLVDLAIKHRSSILLITLINDGARLNYQFHDQKFEYTILHAACYYGMTNVVQACLARPNVNINIRNNFNETPLHFAVRSGRIAVVDILMNHNANAKAVTNSGMTLLHYTVHANTFDQVQMDVLMAKIISLGININATNINSQTTLHMCVQTEYYNFKCLQSLLIQPGIDINAKDKLGLTAVDLAFEDLNIIALTLLIKNGAQFHIDILNYAQNCKAIDLLKACISNMPFFKLFDYPHLHKIAALLGRDELFNLLKISDQKTVQLLNAKIDVLELHAHWIKSAQMREKIRECNLIINRLRLEIECSSCVSAKVFSELEFA